MRPTPSSVLALARREGAPTIVAQGISSARSLLFLLAAAQFLSASDFGELAVVVTVGFILTELLRAAATHQLALTNHSGAAGTEALNTSIAVYVLASASIAVLLAATTLVLEHPATFPVGALAYTGVALFDATRTGSIHVGRADRALRADATWLVLLGIGVSFCWWVDASPAIVAATWGASALLAATLTLPPPRSVRRAALSDYRSDQGRTVGAMVVQVGLESVPSRILPLVALGAIGVEEVGSLRGAEVLLGAVTVVWSGFALSVQRPAARRAEDESAVQTLRYLAIRMAVPIALTVANVLVVLALPDQLGERLLGDSWEGARSLLAEVSILLAALIALSIVTLSLRARKRHHEASLVSLVAAVAASIAVLSSVLRAGAEEVLLGDAAGIFIATCIGVFILVSPRRDRGADHDEEHPPRGR